jgi:sigma-E factor negative regulatory protein RseC
MSANNLEHRGIVQHIEGGKAIVAMETAGCGSCSQGSACGIGQMASGRAAMLLTLPVSGDIRVGDSVSIVLPQSRLTLSALLGYLFPVIALLLGAGLGATLDGSDEATALGAIVGFLGALGLARIALWIAPGLLPTLQLIPLAPPSPASIPLSQHSQRSPLSPLSQQEFRHERSYDH